MFPQMSNPLRWKLVFAMKLDLELNLIVKQANHDLIVKQAIDQPDQAEWLCFVSSLPRGSLRARILPPIERCQLTLSGSQLIFSPTLAS